jgi:polyvinyl alcohol dehydrogenase (cytochrome)
MNRVLAMAAMLFCAAWAGGPAKAARAPNQIVADTCSHCHNGTVPRAPHAIEFPMLGPEQIYTALTTGAMQAQGAALSDQEKRSVAEFLGGRALQLGGPPPMPKCTGASARFDFAKPPRLDGWGMSPDNHRFAAGDVAKLTARDVPSLELKWAFGFPSATRARSQPAIAAGAAYVGSQDGTLYALDLATGCVRWTFKAGAEVRNSPVIESWRAGDSTAKPRIFIGDFNAEAYALDARTGALLWKTRVDPHPRATITGSPRLFEGKLFVPVSSNEWASAADPGYECCTFRGGLASLEANTGKELWHGHSIEQEPAYTGKTNSAGARLRGPGGAPIWNSPTIDAKRRRIYVGTGESYTSPAADTSDSVIAFDLDTGKQVWHHQSLPKDAWNMACFIGGGPNCPVENGPDLDIGASTVLLNLSGGKSLVLAGQKSADVFALDPDAGGKLVWKNKLGRGGYAGGVHWGIALAGTTLYVPIADTKFLPGEQSLPAHPGLNAVNALTGAKVWFTPAPDVCRSDQKPACDAGLSAPPTVMEGAVFAGSFDGHLRAYDTKNGKILWDFDTAREFETINGIKAHGGSIEAAGPVIADGLVLVNSGYLFGGRMGGNVLLAFGVSH